MIGPFIRGAKGIYDGYKLDQENEKLEKEIDKYKDPDVFLKDLKGIERVAAQNNLILAEYMIKRSQITTKRKSKKIQKLWAQVKDTMNTKLEAVENELKQQQATKLDIARILTGLSQIAGETDKELTTLKEELDQKLAKLGAEQNKEYVDTQIRNLNKALERSRHYQNQILQEIGKIRNNIYKDIEDVDSKLNAKIDKVSNTTRAEIKSVKIKLDNELNEIQKEIRLINSNTEQLYRQYVSSMKEISILKDDFKKEMNNITQKISEMNSNVEDMFEKHKKDTFNKILPLYVIAAALSGFMLKTIIS